MDLGHLIKVSSVDEVLVHWPWNEAPWKSRLSLSVHHLILTPHQQCSRTKPKEVIQILHRGIDAIIRRPNVANNQTNGSILVKCKDLRIIRIDGTSFEELSSVAQSLEKLAAIDDITRSFAFSYTPDFKPLEDGWNAFPIEVEFSNLLISHSSDWRVSYVNKDYSVCSSYPRAVIVPNSITDEQLISSANFRQAGRFPVLSYRHSTGQVIVRCSQPLTGPQMRRCKDDEKILAALIHRQRRGYIIDTRTPSVSQSAKAKGGGFEVEQYYPRWKRINKSIDRYHFLLDSYSKLMEACTDTNTSCEKWLSRLTISSWLTHVKEVLNCGCLIAQCLEKENASVVVHGSEGMDISLCVTSLAQMILSSDCRTIRGFEALIQREWVEAGHPFWSRTSKGAFNDSVASKSKSHAPTFTLFLDCVWQIYNQFPCSFEFTEKFLIFLADQAYCSNFGTFLCDNERERELLKVKEDTLSLWSYLNRPEILEPYINCLYDPNKNIIWPSVAPISLNLWSGMYLRWVLGPSPSTLAFEKAQIIIKRNKEARTNVIRLRRRLMDLTGEAEKLGLLESNEPHDEKDKMADEEVAAINNGIHMVNEIEATL